MNPDVEELERYNREAKQRACPHERVRAGGYGGWDYRCLDCSADVSFWETAAYLRATAEAA